MLRAVRLLPDTVKIGIEPDTALLVNTDEEQVTDVESAENTETSESKALQEAQGKLEELQSALAYAVSEKQSLESRLSVLQSELNTAKADFIRKEQELHAGLSAAREAAEKDGFLKGEQNGREKGYSEGIKQANDEAEASYREKLGALVNLLESYASELEKDFSELVALNQPRLLRLWQEMLSRMLKREVDLMPDAVAGVLSDVIPRLGDKNQVIIYVAPEDLDYLQSRVDKDFADILRGVKSLELKADSNVDKGSCIVETRLGVYDARWRTQMAQIESAVEKLIQKLGKGAKKTPQPRKKKTVEDIESPETPPAKAAPRAPAKRAKRTVAKPEPEEGES